MSHGSPSCGVLLALFMAAAYAAMRHSPGALCSFFELLGVIYNILKLVLDLVILALTLVMADQPEVAI